MLRNIKSRALRCAKCRNGVAATEFALLMPVLVILFFGMLELSDLMTMNRRVAIAVNTMADLTAQTESVTRNDLDNLIDGVFAIIETNDTSNLKVNIVSVELDGNASPVVHWSQDIDGNEPYPAGSAYDKLDDDSVVPSTGSVIVVEITYPFVPRFAGHFVTAPFTFSRMALRWPRLSRKVQLCENDGTNCTT